MTASIVGIFASASGFGSTPSRAPIGPGKFKGKQELIVRCAPGLLGERALTYIEYATHALRSPSDSVELPGGWPKGPGALVSRGAFPFAPELEAFSVALDVPSPVVARAALIAADTSTCRMARRSALVTNCGRSLSSAKPLHINLV